MTRSEDARASAAFLVLLRPGDTGGDEQWFSCSRLPSKKETKPGKDVLGTPLPHLQSRHFPGWVSQERLGAA